jgi:hypothetical protein
MSTNAHSDATFRWSDIEIFIGSAETPLYRFKQELRASDPGDTLNRGGPNMNLNFWLYGQGLSIPIMIMWAGS